MNAPNADGGHRIPDAPEHEIPSEDSIGKSEISTRTLVIIALVITVLLLGLLALGIVPRMTRRQHLADEAQQRAKALPIVAFTVAREAGKIAKLELPGTIEPLRDTSVYARISGYVRAWHVDIGDSVKEGQLLVELETPELDQQLKQAQAALSQSSRVINIRELDLGLAQKTLGRYEKAKANGVPGAISERDLDTQSSQTASAAANLSVAQANVDASQADLRRLSEQKRFARVLAPFAGRITSRSVEVGQLVAEGTGQTLFHLMQANPLRVFVFVPQRFAPLVRAGQTAEVRVREHADRVFQGSIARTADSIDAATRTMRVEVHVANDDDALLPGMFGQVKLALDVAQPAITVPSTALLVGARGTRLAVVDQAGKLAYRDVNVGRDNGDTIEIVSGLDRGAHVITNLANELPEGTKVDAREAKRAPDKPGAGNAADKPGASNAPDKPGAGAAKSDAAVGGGEAGKDRR
jgi:membrane fusion protein, multidrug efflux system